MRIVYFGFSEPNKKMIGSQLIKWWTGAEYSHCYVRFVSERLGISNVYQAGHGMVHFMEFENFKSGNRPVKEYAIELTDEAYDNLLIICMRLAGIKYGYMELVNIFLHDLANRLNFDWKVRDGRGFICSELAGRLCIDALGMQFKKPTYLLSPPDIDAALAEKGVPCELF